MDLVDRYLQAVKKHLPWKRQDDIIAELRANLESQIEDKESEMGRTLTPGEVEAILKRMGPPILVAGRYQPRQYLIGPGLFPIYWYVMRLAMLWATVIYTVVSGVQVALAEPGSAIIVESLLRVPAVLFLTAAWITAAFAAFEYAGYRGWIAFPGASYLQNEWSPSSLPPLDREQSGGKQRSYAQAVAEVVFAFLALPWLLLVPRHPFLLVGPGLYYLRSLPYELAPVWMQFYYWIVALNLVQLCWHSFDLARGAWAQPRPVQQIVFKAIGMTPLFLLITAKDHALVVLKSSAADTAHYAITLDKINDGAHKGFFVIAIIASIQLIVDIAKLSIEKWKNRVA